MFSGFEWMVLILGSLVLVALMLLATLWIEMMRLDDTWNLSRLGESLGLRYRVLGQDHIGLPEPFILHARPGTAPENSMIERSLVSTRMPGLPAIFEYVTYRDSLRLRRFGPPALVLAARVPAGIPSFRLRPRQLFERFLNPVETGVPQHHRVPPGSIMYIDLSEGTEWQCPLPEVDRLAASRLWIQVSGQTVFITGPLQRWHGSRFTAAKVKLLICQALPVLNALDSPDFAVLEHTLCHLAQPDLKTNPADNHFP